MIVAPDYSTTYFLRKSKAYFELLKPRLSMLVAFSCAFGYALATQGHVNIETLTMLYLGGFMLSGASSCINQIIERDLDKIMSRTMNRPLPTNRISVMEAMYFAVICLVLSLAILWIYTNPFTVLLSIVSMVLYSFIYTPLKRVGPVAVFVGATQTHTHYTHIYTHIHTYIHIYTYTHTHTSPPGEIRERRADRERGQAARRRRTDIACSADVTRYGSLTHSIPRTNKESCLFVSFRLLCRIRILVVTIVVLFTKNVFDRA